MSAKQKYVILLFLTLFLVFIFQFTPLSTRAVEFEGGIIPANCRTGCPCTLCDLYQLSLNIIDFLLYGISLPVAAAMLAWGGLKMLTSAGNPTAITEAKKILTNAVIGIILAFLAWLIINALLITLGFGFDAWPSIKWNERPTCQPAGGSCTPDVAGEPGQLQGAGGEPSGQYGCRDREADGVIRQQLTSNGVNVKPYGTNTCLDCLPPSAVNGLIAARGNPSCAANCIIVTGGTESGHASHGCGKATVDVRFNLDALKAFEDSGLPIDAGFGHGVTCEPPGGGSSAVNCRSGNAGVMHIEF